MRCSSAAPCRLHDGCALLPLRCRRCVVLLYSGLLYDAAAGDHFGAASAAPSAVHESSLVADQPSEVMVLRAFNLKHMMRCASALAVALCCDMR